MTCTWHKAISRAVLCIIRINTSERNKIRRLQQIHTILNTQVRVGLNSSRSQCRLRRRRREGRRGWFYRHCSRRRSSSCSRTPTRCHLRNRARTEPAARAALPHSAHSCRRARHPRARADTRAPQREAAPTSATPPPTPTRSRRSEAADSQECATWPAQRGGQELSWHMKYE